jgi:hypothetical protein
MTELFTYRIKVVRKQEKKKERKQKTKKRERQEELSVSSERGREKSTRSSEEVPRAEQRGAGRGSADLISIFPFSQSLLFS